MRFLKNILSTIIAVVLVYFLFSIFALLFAPELLPGISGTFTVYWIIFKNFFAEDLLRTILIAIFVAVVFGTISYKAEKFWIGLIGGVIDIIILFAGLGK